MCAGTFASCGENTADTPVETTSGNSENAADDTEAAEELPNYLTLSENFGGKTFRILGMENPSLMQFTNFEIYAEEENGDIVNDAVYRRNMMIEEKHGVKIEQIMGPLDQTSRNTSHFTYIQNNILSGEDGFDIMFVSTRDVGGVIGNKYAIDLNELPYIDFDEDYWNKETTNDVLEINGKLFLTNSDFSLVDKKRTYTLIYNRDLHKEYSDIVIEDLIREGTWTFDVFSEIVKGVSADLNGDSIIDTSDQWAVLMDSKHAYHAWAIGMGETLVGKDSAGELTILADSESIVNTFSKIHELLVADKNNGFHDQQYSWRTSGIFNEGRALFTTSFLQTLSTLSANTDFDYGVLAWPKKDEMQENYYAYADLWGTVLFGVPITNSDNDLAGFMLEVLSGYSTDTSLHAYYETSCKVKHVYDETSAEMLDLSMSGIIFDLGAIMNFGGIYEAAVYNIPASTSFNYVSSVEAVLDKAVADIDELLAMY